MTTTSTPPQPATGGIQPGNRLEAWLAARMLEEDPGIAPAYLLGSVRIFIPLVVFSGSALAGVALIVVALLAGFFPWGILAFGMAAPAWWAAATVLGEASDYIRRVGPYARPPV